jgi:hypothetical protein
MLKKVVLARNKVIEGAYNPIELFLKFSEAYPNACVFYSILPKAVAGWALRQSDCLPLKTASQKRPAWPVLDR